jgi:hypothetical protein
MKVIILLLLSITMLFSRVYYAKVQPYEIYTVSSTVSGLVVYVNEYNLGEKLSHKPYIKIDAEIDIKELKTLESKYFSTKKVLNATQKVLENFTLSLEKKRKNYNKIKVMQMKSQSEKDREFYALITSENQYLNTQKEIENLKIQLADIELRKIKLQRKISDKKIVANGLVLYELYVKEGQFVGISTPLAKVADISQAKLNIFLEKEDIKNAKQKIVFVDGVKTSYRVSRVVNIADSKNISNYVAQIIIDAPNVFSKLVKVELRDK